MRVGVFDSGVGGITVLTELRRRAPATDFVYLGDTANVPYGTKSPAQIERLSVACALRLKEHKVDAVVVACNTASSWALPAIRNVLGSIPAIGMVEPGVEAALKALKNKTQDKKAPLVVLATRATVKSGAYGTALRALTSAPVHERACPLLVPMIEEGWVDHEILHRTIAEYVGEFAKMKQPGVALLGCTHYPWIQSAIERALPGWTVVNSAEAVAGFLKLAPTRAEDQPGQVEWIFTDPSAIPAFARGLCGDNVHD